MAEPNSRDGLFANDSNIVLAAVLLGQGVALERRSLVSAALGKGELIQISDLCVPYAYPYWLVWQQQDVSKLKQQHFIDWINQEVRIYQETVLKTF